MLRERVFISGVGVVSPIGTGISAFCSSLEHGKNGIGKIERFSTHGMRSEYGGEIKDAFASETAEYRKPIDRASIMALIAAREAWYSSKLGDVDGSQIGVYLGTCGGGYLSGLQNLTQTARRGRGNPNLLLDLPLHAAASRIACEFACHGPVSVVSNACASSAIAIAFGAQLIQAGKVTAMLVGGFDALTPLNAAGFGMMRNSSRVGKVRPFDKNRDGILLGEGAAIFLLEGESSLKNRGAQKGIEFLGWGISSDTYHLTAPDPSGRGAVQSMRQALTNAKVTTSDIGYINAHGTGTPHNDLMETRAIKRVFGDLAYRIPVSSTKSMIGHTLGAAGALELAAAVTSLENGFIPPTINYDTPDPKCDLDYVSQTSRECKASIFLTNSFGFGGTNCSLVAGRRS